MTNKEISIAWYKNVDAGNYDEVRKLMNSNYSFKNSLSPIPADGDTHIAMLTMFSSAFSEMQHTFTRFVNDGEWIAVYGTVTGKHTGDFTGIAPTAKSISNTWMHLFHIVDGKVSDAYFEMNPANIINQISVK
ncbi:ester cyclase [Sphingobacterium sp. Mn56C]|uniref:ester cyclase n=1 Tax=Sphingobacterium sp. Mn56C TaxID=3395261 RepID=UPI003BDCEADC